MNDSRFPRTSTSEDTRRPKAEPVTRLTGWFGPALGAAELLATNTIARAAGSTAGTTLARL
ncbi:hypothetical protein SAMN05446927_0245 [Caballeronia arationis]|jgi:hypothetical protein|uniref:Uncharacterized protein n=1 Tax=Caballeronia arationis TaxID=1777142 RepID=A0A7Z7I1A2_9BURK|nr:hypothetical protein [Caballeronia arationis]SOE47844.1 hypothetical protein SAMN05446927_0245 [Caballeronia arationis]